MPIIEIMVKPGDTVEADAPLMSLESDKATMDIPAPQAGRIVELLVKLGDRVSEGKVVLTMESWRVRCRTGAGCRRLPRRRHPLLPPLRSPPPAAHRPASMKCAVLVIGGGPGGYSAAFRAADLGLDVIIVERYADAGRRVPERRLHSVESAAARRRGGRRGGGAGCTRHQVRRARDRSGCIARLEGQGRRQADRRSGRHGPGRKVKVMRGTAQFVDPHTCRGRTDVGDGRTGDRRSEGAEVRALHHRRRQQSVKLPFMPVDPRVVDSTGALLLADIPKRMLVIGGGIIGLEMATVYSTLGARIEVVEMTGG
jgi:dihydrolipoamide dehydrogenase